MNQIQIENVDLSIRRVGKTVTLEDYPQFGLLQPGQSFFVPNHASGRAQAVPFKLAKETYPDRTFRRVPVEGGVRYGRTA